MPGVIGFTGSRDGMTAAQSQELERRLVGAAALHHGDCIGSDKQAHDLAKGLGIWTVGHPPTNTRMQAYSDVDESREEPEYMGRDYHIADEADEIIATPNTFVEVWRSGTWTTIRYGIQKDKLVTIIYPDGSVEVRNGR
jgi:hypothetical protein